MHHIEAALGIKLHLPPDPQIAGALGDLGRIAVDIWLPAGATGPVPAILILTPYYRRFRLVEGGQGDAEERGKDDDLQDVAARPPHRRRGAAHVEGDPRAQAHDRDALAARGDGTIVALLRARLRLRARGERR